MSRNEDAGHEGNLVTLTADASLMCTSDTIAASHLHKPTWLKRSPPPSTTPNQRLTNGRVS